VIDLVDDEAEEELSTSSEEVADQMGGSQLFDSTQINDHPASSFVEMGFDDAIDQGT